MINYNERLDVIVLGVYNEAYKCGVGARPYHEYRSVEAVAAEAKQAFTSLIKELVAEARLDELTLLADFQIGDITVMGRNERSWRDRISELEQSLLKALETQE